jgi:hypothetical protein
MKNYLISVMVALFLMIPGGLAKDKEPFKAVYCSPDLKQYWMRKQVDYFHEAETWDDLRLFVSEVNRQAEGRPVVIDIDVHGEPEGYLYICKGRNGEDYAASEGFLVNQLDRVENLQIVLQESCYAGVVFKKSLHQPREISYNGNVIEDYKGKLEYPIMGVDNVINYNASINDQFNTGYRLNYNDLREYVFRDPGEPDRSHNNMKCQALRWFTLSVYLAEQRLRG